MATKSFLKKHCYKKSKEAGKFLVALENAEKKKAKKVIIDQRVEEVKDSEQIRKLFAK